MKAFGLVALCCAALCEGGVVEPCMTMRCAAGTVCMNDYSGAVPMGRCVPDKQLAANDICEHKGDWLGQCPKGMVCRPLEGVQTLVSESRCQDPLPTKPKPVACTTMRCGPGYACMTDNTVDPPKDECVPMASPPTKPAQYLKEGEVCENNGDVKGKCDQGLVCRPRDGVQTLVSESVCQKPQIIDPSKPTCASMICIATTTCVEDKVNGARCVPIVSAEYLKEGEVCENNGDVKGKCDQGLVCKPRPGAQTLVSEFVCQKDTIFIDPKPATCASMICIATTTCVEDKVKGARCVPLEKPKPVACTTMRCGPGYTCMTDNTVDPPKDECVPMASPPTKPAQYLKEGEVCENNGDMKGKCDQGLECRPRDGVQTLVSESVCQKPQIIIDPSKPTCASMICIATTTCVEDKVNGARCVPIVSAEYLKEGEVCENNGDVKGKCDQGLVCKPRPGAQTLVSESICQKDTIVIDPKPATCASMICIATTTCVEDKVKGARCVPLEKPKPVACTTMRCGPGYTCMTDNTVDPPKDECVPMASPPTKPAQYLKEGEVCENNGDVKGKCDQGLVCRPRDGVQTLVSESVCQKPQIIIDPSMPTCASMICIATTTCVEDKVNGARCVPIEKPKPMDCTNSDGKVVAEGSSYMNDCNTCTCMNGRLGCTKMACEKPKYLKEGEVCENNGDMKGKCDQGLECKPRDGVQTLVSESVCQKPQIIIDPSRPTCASMICIATTTCVEDKVNGARCVPLEKPKPVACTTMRCGPGYTCMTDNTVDPPKDECVPMASPPTKPAQYLKEGEVCENNGDMKGKCDQGLVCRPRDGAQTLVSESVCQKPQIIIDPSMPTCASMICIATTTCVEDKVKGARCVPLEKPKPVACTTMRCGPGYTCMTDNTVDPPKDECVPMASPPTKPAQYLKEGEVCENNGDMKGKCDQGLECRPRDGIQTLVSESVCQKPQIIIDPSKPTCASMICIATTTCVEDKVNGARCVPIVSAEYLKEGEVCENNGDVKGKCDQGLVCRPRDGVQTLVSESVCQKPQIIIDPTCASVICIATMTCVEDKVKGARCVPLEKPKPLDCTNSDGKVVAEGSSYMNDCNECTCMNGRLGCTEKVCEKPEYLKEGEVCENNGDLKVKCDQGLVCRPRDGVQTLVSESVCQKPQIIIDPPVPTCASVVCIATMTCVEDKVKGARCVAVNVPSLPVERECVEGAKVLKSGETAMRDCNMCLCVDGKMRCEEQECKPLDCRWNMETVAPWTREQKTRCCGEQKVRCPSPAVVDAEKELAKVVAECKKGQRSDEECCAVGVRCLATKFDCDDKTEAPGKKEWCCENENKCEVNCMAGSLLDVKQKAGCCSMKYLWCPAEEETVVMKKQKEEEEEEEEEEKKEGKKSLRLKLKGTTSELMENPKAFLKKFRMSLLRGSEELAKNPSRLVVTAVGSLMVGYTVPEGAQREKWAFKVRASWNAELAVEEKALLEQYKTRTGKALGASAVQTASTAAAGDEGVFGEFFVDEKAAKELEESTEQAANGEGAMRDNTGGYSLVVEPVGVVEAGGKKTTTTTTTDDSSNSGSSSKTWLYALLAGVGALCMGSALALTVYSRKRSTAATADELYNALKEEEVVVHKQAADVELGTI